MEIVSNRTRWILTETARICRNVRQELLQLDCRGRERSVSTKPFPSRFFCSSTSSGRLRLSCAAILALC